MYSSIISKNKFATFMGWFINIKYLYSIFLLLTIFSCKRKSIVPQVREQELAKFIHIDSCNYNFGEVTHTATNSITHKFVLQDNGSEPVFINKVLSGCSCISTTYSKGFINPSDTFSVTITFNYTGKQGRFEKPLLILLNDSKYYIQTKIHGIIL